MLGIAGVGWIAFWNGRKVRSIDGAAYYFATERDAWLFLGVCNAVNGIPKIPVGGFNPFYLLGFVQ